MIEFLGVCLLMAVWLGPGFFAARMSLMDDYMEDEYGMAWMLFFFGWLGWLISMISHSAGRRAEAHFLTVIPLIRFIKNKRKNAQPISKSIFRV